VAAGGGGEAGGEPAADACGHDENVAVAHGFGAAGTRAVSQPWCEFTSMTVMGSCCCMRCWSAAGEMTLNPINRANMILSSLIM